MKQEGQNCDHQNRNPNHDPVILEPLDELLFPGARNMATVRNLFGFRINMHFSVGLDSFDEFVELLLDLRFSAQINPL